MMRTRNNFLLTIIILVFSILSSSNLFAEETWTLAAAKFSYARGQKQSAVTDATAAMFPARILENISLSLSRVIPTDEALERLRYKSKNDRASLFLQMSSAIQKRDVLFLENYSDKELKKKIEQQNKAIDELREKINKSLEEIKEEEEKYERVLNGSSEVEEGFSKYLEMVRNIFVADQNVTTNENIVLYKNDVTAFFQPGESALKEGFNSRSYEKELISAGIDGLLTGTLISYGDFISLTVDVYSYPGAKKIGSVTEIGSLAEAEYISKSIARQLVPVITNSLPITVGFTVEPEFLRQKTSLYVDEQFFSELPTNLVLESGVHRLEFMANGYRRISTSYYFEGNHVFVINAKMEEEISGNVNLNLKNPAEGELFANGMFQKTLTVFEDEEGKKHSDSASISVNGKTILGEFIAKDGSSAFYYIPEDMLRNHSDFSLKVKTFDRSEYIEKRRKGMYRAYSALVVSLIPSMYVGGQKKAYLSYLENNDNITTDFYNKAKNYYYADKVFKGIAIGCGAWFAVEFIRYLIAANTVLPASVVADKDFIFYENPNPVIQNEIEESETEDEVQTENRTEIIDNTGNEIDLESESDSENQN